jgi:hypothetical protein
MSGDTTMTRIAPLFLLIAGCTGGESDSDVVYTPTLSFLAPLDGSTVAAGDVAVSIVVDDFILTAPESARLDGPALPLPLMMLESAAEAHNEEGTPAGYCQLSVNDSEVTKMDTTQFTIPTMSPGTYTLTGTLFFADGDELETPVSATVSFTAE